MDWIRKIIEKHTDEDGKLNLEEAIKEINKEAPKNVVPKDVYNTVSADKKAAEAKVKEYEDAKLTDEERQQQALETANAEKEKYQKLSNRIEVERILLGAGMTEEDYKDFIDGIVTTDIEGSKTIANAMVTTFKAKLSAAEEQAKNDMLKATPRPSGGDGSNNSGDKKTQQQLIAEELANSNAETMKAAKSALEYYGGK